MRVDLQTLNDLEVFGTVSRAPGLLDHLDRTRTRGGREAFRRRLTQPLASAGEIREVQRALAYIGGHRQAFADLPDQERLAALLQYLDSRYTTLMHLRGAAIKAESAWIRLRYRDLYREAVQGVRLVGRFLHRVHELLIEAGDAAGILAVYLDELSELLDSHVLRDLRRDEADRWWWWDILVTDRAARELGRPTLQRMVAILNELDALVAMADVTAEKGFCFPQVVEEPPLLEIEGLYHPFLENPVVNQCRLDAATRLVFLTGPNMAGKTTYLKACGILVLLAHAGMGVPARRCRLGVVHTLIAALRVEDSLREGISYFQAEARRVKEIAQAVARSRRCLVIIDEMFRGTNVKDAADATRRVLVAFAAVRESFYLIASHLIELAGTLAGVEGMALQRFEARLAGADVVFDYRIGPGVSDQRMGMTILQREGVLAALDALARDDAG